MPMGSGNRRRLTGCNTPDLVGTSLRHFDRLIKSPPRQFTDLDIGAVVNTKPEIVKNWKGVNELGEDLLKFGRRSDVTERGMPRV